MGAPDLIATLLSFHPFLAILCSSPVGYSTTLTDQHGPQEQLTAKFRPGNVEIDKTLSLFFKQFRGQSFIPLSVWEVLTSFIRCVRTSKHTSPNHNKKNLQPDVDRKMHRLPSESPVDGKTHNGDSSSGRTLTKTTHVNRPIKLATTRILFWSIGTPQRSSDKYNEDA